MLVIPIFLGGLGAGCYNAADRGPRHVDARPHFRFIGYLRRDLRAVPNEESFSDYYDRAY